MSQPDISGISQSFIVKWESVLASGLFLTTSAVIGSTRMIEWVKGPVTREGIVLTSLLHGVATISGSMLAKKYHLDRSYQKAMIGTSSIAVGSFATYYITSTLLEKTIGQVSLEAAFAIGAVNLILRVATYSLYKLCQYFSPMPPKAPEIPEPRPQQKRVDLLKNNMEEWKKLSLPTQMTYNKASKSYNLELIPFTALLQGTSFTPEEFLLIEEANKQDRSKEYISFLYSNHRARVENYSGEELSMIPIPLTKRATEDLTNEQVKWHHYSLYVKNILLPEEVQQAFIVRFSALGLAIPHYFFITNVQEPPSTSPLPPSPPRIKIFPSPVFVPRNSNPAPKEETPSEPPLKSEATLSSTPVITPQEIKTPPQVAAAPTISPSGQKPTLTRSNTHPKAPPPSNTPVVGQKPKLTRSLTAGAKKTILSPREIQLKAYFSWDTFPKQPGLEAVKKILPKLSKALSDLSEDDVNFLSKHEGFYRIIEHREYRAAATALSADNLKILAEKTLYIDGFDSGMKAIIDTLGKDTHDLENKVKKLAATGHPGLTDLCLGVKVELIGGSKSIMATYNRLRVMIEEKRKTEKPEYHNKTKYEGRHHSAPGDVYVAPPPVERDPKREWQPKEITDFIANIEKFGAGYKEHYFRLVETMEEKNIADFAKKLLEVDLLTKFFSLEKQITFAGTSLKYRQQRLQIIFRNFSKTQIETSTKLNVFWEVIGNLEDEFVNPAIEEFSAKQFTLIIENMILNYEVLGYFNAFVNKIKIPEYEKDRVLIRGKVVSICNAFNSSTSKERVKTAMFKHSPYQSFERLNIQLLTALERKVKNLKLPGMIST